MSFIDMLLVETGSGADLAMSGNDLIPARGIENQPYIGMFGDNGEGWWGNDLLLAGGVNNQFISQTEQALAKYALNSNGRLRDIAAITADLQFLVDDLPGSSIAVDATIVNTNRLSVVINLNGLTIKMEWNPATLFLTYQL